MTLAYVLAVARVLGLIFFLAHLAQTIRVESMLRSVHEDASANLRRELGQVEGAPATLRSLIPVGPSTLVTAASSGFLVRIHEDDLLDVAVQAHVVVLVDVCPGNWLVADTPGGAVWQVSPGINDPTTAIHAMGHVSALLGELVHRDLGPRILRDERGRTRVVLARPDLAVLLRLALDQPGRYGCSDPAVLAPLCMLLRELAWVCAPHQRPVVAVEVARLRRLVAAQHLDDEGVAELEASAERVDAALSGSWDVGSRS